MGDAMAVYPVREVLRHRHDLVTLRFEAVFDAEPGQFAFLWVPGVAEKPLSISDIRDGHLDLSILAVGAWSRACCQVRPGELLGLRGPFGTAFRPRSRTVMVGGGAGIAPIRFLAWREVSLGRRPTVLLGARSRDHLLFADELSQVADVHLATDDGSAGHRGLVTDLLPERAGEADLVCACGPEPMLLAVRDVARRAGAAVQLSLERYMKCGLGICGQCCLDGSGIRLCVEGPVLDDEALDGVTELGLPHRDATGAR